jgi:hypothetical protein
MKTNVDTELRSGKNLFNRTSNSASYPIFILVKNLAIDTRIGAKMRNRRTVD